MRKQVVDRDREKVIRVHEAGVARHDAVPIRVCVVARDDIEVIAIGGDGLHDARRRRIHANLAVPVEVHERPLRVDARAEHREVQFVAVADRRPVRLARPAERMRADAHTRFADRGEIDHGLERVDVFRNVVVVAHRHCVALCGLLRVTPGAALDQLVRPRSDPRGRVRAGWSAVRRVVLEAAVARRVVTRGHHDAVGAMRVVCRTIVVVREDGATQGRGRHEGFITAASRQQHVHAGCREYARRNFERGRREGVRVTAEKQRALDDALRRAVLCDREADRRDVRLIERSVQRGAAVPRGAEDHSLRGDRRVWDHLGECAQQRVDVDQIARLGPESRSFMHGTSLPARRSDPAQPMYTICPEVHGSNMYFGSDHTHRGCYTQRTR